MKVKLKIFFVIFINYFSLYSVRPIITFSGEDIKNKLIQLISREQKCIKVAMYMFTDKDIAQKLINARKRGVRVEAVVDNSTVNSPNGMANSLRNKDIAVMKRKSLPFHSFMHLKCWAFESTRLNSSYKYRPCVFTGSCNCTYNGAYRNDEMMVLLFGEDIFRQCNKKFKALKSDSRYISKDDKD